MRVFKSCFLCVSVFALVLVGGSEAAFIVEAHSSGLANANFQGTGVASLRSFAVGTQAGSSLVSGTCLAGTENGYVYSYTPGVDVDNFLPAAGTDLGNDNSATGIVGGETGFYNVYVTWCNTANVSSTSKFTITHDGGEYVVTGVNQNGSNEGGNNRWLLLTTDGPIELTAGQTYTVTHEAESFNCVALRSHGVMWEAVEPVLVPVTLSVDELQVEEGGPAQTYTCVLDQQPTSDVFMTIRAHHDPNNVSINGHDPNDPVVLVFTPDDWDQPQTVTVEAVDDVLMEGPMTVLLRHSTDTDPNGGQGDPTYADGFAGYIKVTVIDNDGPDVGIQETDGSTEVIEGGADDTFGVRLLYPPTDPVTVTMTVAGAGDPAAVQIGIDVGAGPVDQAELVFTSDDWDVPQDVIVSAFDDAELEYVHTSTISFAVASGDGEYDGLAVDDLVVTIQDNECGAWGFQAMDFDRDCVVSLSDLARVAESWLTCTQPYADGCDDLR